MTTTTCKSCGDRINVDAEWRQLAPRIPALSVNEYCKTCYMELATGEIPNVISSTVAHGSGGLTPRQAIKRH